MVVDPVGWEVLESFAVEQEVQVEEEEKKEEAEDAPFSVRTLAPASAAPWLGGPLPMLWSMFEGSQPGSSTMVGPLQHVPRCYVFSYLRSWEASKPQPSAGRLAGPPCCAHARWGMAKPHHRGREALFFSGFARGCPAPLPLRAPCAHPPPGLSCSSPGPLCGRHPAHPRHQSLHALARAPCHRLVPPS